MRTQNVICVSYDGLPTTDYDKPYWVSMIRLIANPEQHHGKWVRATGFKKNNRLYLTKDDMKNNNHTSSLALSFNERIGELCFKSWNGEMVSIAGKYDMNYNGFNVSSGNGALVLIKDMRRD